MNWGRLPTTETTFTAASLLGQYEVEGARQRGRGQLPLELPRHPATGVEHEGRRLYQQAERADQAVVRVEDDGPSPPVPVDVPKRAGARVVDRHPHELHAPVIPAGDVGEGGALGAAGRAPRGEEVDHHGRPPQPPQ